MYELNTYRAATTLWDLANSPAVGTAAGQPDFLLTTALEIISEGRQWKQAQALHQQTPESANPHLFVTNELNTILAEVTGKRPGAFPAFLVGSNPFVKTEEGVAFVSLASGYETAHQIYAGITEHLIFVRAYAAKPDDEDFTKDAGEEQVSADPLVLKYEYILQYGDNGAIIQAHQLYETFDNDELQEFVFRVLKDALLANAFNAHQKAQLDAELLRFTATVNMYESMLIGAFEDTAAAKTRDQLEEDVLKTRVLGAYYAYFNPATGETPEAKERLKTALKEFLEFGQTTAVDIAG